MQKKSTSNWPIYIKLTHRHFILMSNYPIMISQTQIHIPSIYTVLSDKYSNQINDSNVLFHSFFLLLYIFIYYLPKSKTGMLIICYKLQRDVGDGGKQNSVVNKNVDSRWGCLGPVPFKLHIRYLNIENLFNLSSPHFLHLYSGVL